ncbi:MAG TPA: FHA domain-containing protein [Chthoniobacteraceae bacterium]|jgi:predicted component of type VI protein secretion system|nr:domain containing protein [Chthoniobacter sp.]HEV7869073.1 FHA domain-containing protein [Chthoniobacteraceae bacterium]
MPKLTVSLPDGPESVHELSEDVITIGRVSDNLLQIDDASVSSHHAQLTLVGTDYILQDLGSTNGTRLNGQQVSEGEDHKLTEGDTIRFGSVTTLYGSENAADAQPMPQEVEVAAVPAAASVRPADFSNASPFQKKKSKRDGKATGILVFGAVSLLVFFGAVALILGMKSPL